MLVLRTFWKIAYWVIFVSGWAFAFITFVFGDLDDVLRFVGAHRDSIIAIVALIFLACFYFWLTWMTGRVVWGGIRGWLQKRRDSRQLRALAKNIAFAKQFTYSRIARTESSEMMGWLFDAAAVIRQNDLRKDLAELAIPHPEPVEKPSESEEFHWAVYLDILLPLAVVGDIKEARLVLERVSPSPEDSDSGRLFGIRGR